MLRFDTLYLLVGLKLNREPYSPEAKQATRSGGGAARGALRFDWAKKLGELVW
jgi:hypothetical protein